jgi:hypothetical protein
MAGLFDIVSVQKLDGVVRLPLVQRDAKQERRPFVFFHAGIAQLEERRPRNAEAACSIQAASTKYS